MKRIYKERRLYFSETCVKCGKPFKSFKRARVKNGVCKRKTCRYSVPDNQTRLFSDLGQVGGDNTTEVKVNHKPDGGFKILGIKVIMPKES